MAKKTKFYFVVSVSVVLKYPPDDDYVPYDEAFDALRGMVEDVAEYGQSPESILIHDDTEDFITEDDDEEEETLDNHEHNFGDWETTRLTGNPIRRCVFPGCDVVTMDGDEDAE